MSDNKDLASSVPSSITRKSSVDVQVEVTTSGVCFVQECQGARREFVAGGKTGRSNSSRRTVLS